MQSHVATAPELPRRQLNRVLTSRNPATRRFLKFGREATHLQAQRPTAPFRSVISRGAAVAVRKRRRARISESSARPGAEVVRCWLAIVLLESLSATFNRSSPKEQ